MVRELTMQHILPTTDVVIVRKARELIDTASAGVESPANLRSLSQGFQELSVLADQRREYRMACVSKALSAIFRRQHEGNPDDLPFILNIALNFLDAIQAPNPFETEGN